ncbi:MAG: biotin carboxylase N-terminal domain-containing protein [Geodermatophilaceae bacterium]
MGQAGRHREGLRVFETVLVADRGLLAVRVIRSCQRLGIKAVSCVTEGDENALHTRVADEIIRLGVADPRSTEAVVEAVIEAARVSGAQAIHPGGGPWAADAAFAGAVLATDLAWVGAPPAYRLNGTRRGAKRYGGPAARCSGRPRRPSPATSPRPVPAGWSDRIGWSRP